jgi:hypothetical protein
MTKYKKLLENFYLFSKNIDDFKAFLSLLSENDKYIIKQIVVLKKINQMILNNPNNKFEILKSVYAKYKQKVIPKTLLFSIIKIDANLNKKLNWTLLLPEQKKNILEKYKLDARIRYAALSEEEKKKKRENNIEKLKKKMGDEKYKLFCSANYKRWYDNLSHDKKIMFSNKRKERYEKLSDDIKIMYKENKKRKLSSLSQNEKQELYKTYLKNKKEKIKNMSVYEKKLYYERLSLRKKIYFDNIPIEKKKIINKFRTFKRQLDRNNISKDEYEQKKNIIKNENMQFL